MITKPDVVKLSRPFRNHPVAREVYFREVGEATASFLALNPPRGSWDQQLVRHCQCCGESPASLEQRGIVRCVRHVGRNPCAIEGCGRTRAATGHGGGFWHGNNHWLCGTHWRAFVPPGSVERRVYNRLWRFERRFGQTEEWVRRYWRVFGSIIARARARATGNLDEEEIKRLFGWD